MSAVNILVEETVETVTISVTNGADGEAGAAATVAVGTTTTGEPGTNASVTETGTAQNKTFDFLIPRGAVGAAATVAAGTTTTGDAGTDASVTETGDAQNKTFNFVIPRGAAGIAGSATVSIGTTTTGAAGSAASVANSGTGTEAVLDFILPAGEEGSGGTELTTPAVLLNDIRRADTNNASYNNTNTFVWIPATNNTANGYITKISIEANNALAGRKMNLFLFTRDGTTNNFITQYIGTDDFPAELDGLNEATLPTRIAIKETQMFGVSLSTTVASSAVRLYSGGGSSSDEGGTGHFQNITSLTLLVPTSMLFMSNRGLSAKAYVEEAVASSRINNPSGLSVIAAVDSLVGSTVFNERDWFFGKKILYVGTSIPAGGTTQEARYPDIMGRILGADVENVAIGGSRVIFTNLASDNFNVNALMGTIAEKEALFSDSATAVAASYETLIIGKTYDYLVIDHYVNDRSQIRFGSMGTISDTTAATFYGAFNVLLASVYADKPAAKVLLVACPNIYTTANAQIDQAGQDAITALKEIALKYHLPFLNQAEEGYVNTSNFTVYNSDGTHPTDDAERARRGYAVAQFIKRHP
jgi:hypothetical protein